MKKYKPDTTPTQKDEIDNYCAFSTSKKDALEQLELLSQKSNITKEELNAFNRKYDKELQPFIDNVKDLFKPFDIDVDLEQLVRGDFTITLMLPAPFPIEIVYCYDFNEDIDTNIKLFKKEFKIYCQFFTESCNILSNIKDTF